MAGEVAEVFEGDDHSFKVGDRVCALLGGGNYSFLIYNIIAVIIVIINVS